VRTGREIKVDVGARKKIESGRSEATTKAVKCLDALQSTGPET